MDGGIVRPTVAVLATGGTIANTGRGRLGIERVIEDIVGRLASPDDVAAQLDVREVLRAGAETFGPHEWLEIGRAVEEAASNPAVDGIVVTHGTFTAEETAYFLHLTVHTDKPVVVVCSQRKHDAIGNDGDRNLLDAIRVAASHSAQGTGVTLVMNEEIHCARDVSKTNQRPSGFQSGSLGILGTVEVDQVSVYRRPTRRHTATSEFTLPDNPTLPRVDIVASYPGADSAPIRSVVAAGSMGIVVNGYAYSGKPAPDQFPALAEAVDRGLPVVLVNRGGGGRVPADTSNGFVRGDNLTAQKARILLMLALAHDVPGTDLQRVFGDY